MKKSPGWKWLILVYALLLWGALSYYLVVMISFSDFELDFSLQNQLRTALGITKEARTPSLVQPMLYMLYAASGGTLVLIVLQFVSLLRSIPSPRWLTFTRIMQVMIGLTSAILLVLIGRCLKVSSYGSFLPFILSGLLVVRLILFSFRALFAKR